MIRRLSHWSEQGRYGSLLAVREEVFLCSFSFQNRSFRKTALSGKSLFQEIFLFKK